jgi:PAS domain S-box-containing protein
MGTTDPVNILMVDDQPGKLLTYGAILGELGENLITATTAREALDTLLRLDIAIVLMDVSMPEIDGFELAAMIRQHPRFQETAIIFVSGVHLTDLDRLKGYEAGAVDYIPVPVVPEILRAKVGTFAELHRKRRQLEELNRELERRVEERTAALEAAAARLRASEERLQVILRNTSAVIYLVGPDDTFLHVNRGFEALFGCHNDEIHGLPLRAVLPPNVAAMYAANHRRVVAEGASVEFEEVIPRPDGARTYTSIQTPLFDDAGRPAGVVGVATDITERKRAEDERAELLRREREARLEAEAATQARDEFVSVAAHELKTPVTGLRTTAQVMARRMTKAGLEIPGWLSDGLRVVDQQSDRLARLIGQLLDLSRLDQDNLLGERTATDLVALAERLVAAARARATQHRLVLTTDASVVVDVDMVSIEQVLSNLLDNAIKYSPDGGQVDVEVGALEDGRARMAVRDRGLGIPPKKRGAIFERFYRAHGDDHRSGLGLGLYISQRIVALHGGEIVAEFPPDGGTRFMVLLPTRATARERGRPRAKSAATSRGE